MKTDGSGLSSQGLFSRADEPELAADEAALAATLSSSNSSERGIVAGPLRGLTSRNHFGDAPQETLRATPVNAPPRTSASSPSHDASSSRALDPRGQRNAQQPDREPTKLQAMATRMRQKALGKAPGSSSGKHQGGIAVLSEIGMALTRMASAIPSQSEIEFPSELHGLLQVRLSDGRFERLPLGLSLEAAQDRWRDELPNPSLPPHVLLEWLEAASKLPDDHRFKIDDEAFRNLLATLPGTRTAARLAAVRAFAAMNVAGSGAPPLSARAVGQRDADEIRYGIHTVEQVISNIVYRNHRIDAADLEHLRAVAAETASTGGPRLSFFALRDQEDAIRYGESTLEQIIRAITRRAGSTHAEDLAQLNAVAAETARTGGPRLSAHRMSDHEAAIRDGQSSVEEVVRITTRRAGSVHVDDLAHLQAVAAGTTRFAGAKIQSSDEA